MSEVDTAEVDEPATVSPLPDADALTGEGVAEGHLADAGHVELAAAVDPKDVVVGRVPRLRHDALEEAHGPDVDVSRSLHPDAFVRADRVELVDEVVETLLLLKQVGACWPGRLELEGAVHAL